MNGIRSKPARVYFLVTGRRMLLDWPFYLVIVVYGLVVSAAAQLNDTGELFSPLIYLKRWMNPITLVVALALCVAGYASLRHPSPIRAFFAKIRRIIPPARLASALLFVGLAIFHGIFTSMKNVTNRIVEFRFDVGLADLDAALHFGDPWKLLPQVETLTLLVQFFYVVGWLTLLAVMSFYATMYAQRAVRNQYVWSFLICWVLLGNVVAMATMSAGPVYYAAIVGSDRFQPLVDYLAFSDNWRFSSVNVSEKLWLKYSSDATSIGAGISAFPSLHLSMATLWALVAYRRNVTWGRIMVAFLVLTQVASVHLGWHYAIDGYFSILATVVVWKLVGAWQDKRSLLPQLRPFPGLAPGMAGGR